MVRRVNYDYRIVPVGSIRHYLPIVQDILMDRDPKDLAFAAGVFVADGCFSHSVDRRGKVIRRYPTAALQMTDADVVERFAQIVGFCNVRFRKGRTPSHRPVAYWQVYGFEKTQALAAMLWPYLSRRYKDRYVAEIKAHQANEIPDGYEYKPRPRRIP